MRPRVPISPWSPWNPLGPTSPFIPGNPKGPRVPSTPSLPGKPMHDQLINQSINQSISQSTNNQLINQSINTYRSIPVPRDHPCFQDLLLDQGVHLGRVHLVGPASPPSLDVQDLPTRGREWNRQDSTLHY